MEWNCPATKKADPELHVWHVCKLGKDHKGLHVCKCGEVWR